MRLIKRELLIKLGGTTKRAIRPKYWMKGSFFIEKNKSNKNRSKGEVIWKKI
jgi:hypothetical protein